MPGGGHSTALPVPCPLLVWMSLLSLNVAGHFYRAMKFIVNNL